MKIKLKIVKNHQFIRSLLSPISLALRLYLSIFFSSPRRGASHSARMYGVQRMFNSDPVVFFEFELKLGIRYVPFQSNWTRLGLCIYSSILSLQMLLFCTTIYSEEKQQQVVKIQRKKSGEK